MADANLIHTLKSDPRGKAVSKYILEMDYHLMNMQGLMKATGCLAGEVQNNLKPKDSGGDVECLLTLFFIMRDHFELMVESTDRRCEAGA